jgi:hypothetical protein
MNAMVLTSSVIFDPITERNEHLRSIHDLRSGDVAPGPIEAGPVAGRVRADSFVYFGTGRGCDERHGHANSRRVHDDCPRAPKCSRHCLVAVFRRSKPNFGAFFICVVECFFLEMNCGQSRGAVKNVSCHRRARLLGCTAWKRRASTANRSGPDLIRSL